jgi:hypothetical protein
MGLLLIVALMQSRQYIQHHETEFWIYDTNPMDIRKCSGDEDPTCTASQSQLTTQVESVLADIRKYGVIIAFVLHVGNLASAGSWANAHSNYIIPKMGACSGSE